MSNSKIRDMNLKIQNFPKNPEDLSALGGTVFRMNEGGRGEGHSQKSSTGLGGAGH
jgi:hypothetical protein